MICHQSCHWSGQEAAKTDETALDERSADTSVGGVSGQEAEISRLTWAVIDGKASHEERSRLAELVSAQHEQRHS